MHTLTATLAHALAARYALVEREIANPQACAPAATPDCSQCGGSKAHAAWVSLTERCAAPIHA